MDEKETFLGIKISGEWHEVTVESEKACIVLKEHLGEERVRQFERWKPHENEDIEDVKERTIQNSLTKHTKVEENGEIQEKAREGVEEIKNGDVKNGTKDIFQTIRPIEKNIYKHIIARFNPLFFKNKKVESNIKEKRNQYEMEIAVNDEKARKKLKKEMLKENKDKNKK
ncbi:hypothetical protein AMET1_1356 [Methanonatronarchaeum thermophilum]|uniref:Uncharacterized protein n=1 Tax=Methanonatronarchaeum thermophilum TaxID=1927129 RepID=A0A1Y3GB21_9EURY|nr:DUF5828 family protein [Methanonatronarchaeum thermophilum]OUJ18440.1 hypothetical protein AMET1_1356 [Methanonatronarchaeum thermophilum]